MIDLVFIVTESLEAKYIKTPRSLYSWQMKEFHKTDGKHCR